VGEAKIREASGYHVQRASKEHPDLTAAEANLAAAEAVGATPDVNLLRAKSMYGSALRFHRAGRFKKTAAKKVHTRKRRAARKRKV
jgi:hypothetical protein